MNPAKILNLGITGLGTDPESSDCGMRPMVAKLYPASEYPNAKYVAHAWDEANPGRECQILFEVMTAEPFDEVNIFAHSFGDSMAIRFFEWLAKWFPEGRPDGSAWIANYVNFDGVENGCMGLTEWSAQGPKIVRRAFNIFQRNGYVAFIKGKPLPTRPDGSVVVYNVTDRRDVQRNDGITTTFEDWGSGPTPTHVDWSFPSGQCLITLPETLARVSDFLFFAAVPPPAPAAYDTAERTADGGATNGGT